MANTGVGFGFQAFGWQDGAAPTAGQVPYVVRSSNATAIFTGDLVIQSTADPPCVTRQTTTQFDTRVVGVFVGCKYYSPTIGRVVWNNQFPGSVATSSGTADVTAYVVDDPNTLWTVRGGSVVLAASYIGYNVGTFSSYTGNTATGQSLVRINAASITAVASLPFRIVDLLSNHAPPGSEGCDNTAGSNIAVVAPNNWLRNSLTGVAT